MSSSPSNNTNTTTTYSTCTICCNAPCKAVGSTVCSLRCSWKSKQQCVQCGRQVKDEKLPFPDHQDFKIFCGALCLDEARRGNWCIGCGVKQVTTQGLSRCSHDCMSVDVPLPHESPFPSRRTTPGDNNNNDQQGGLSRKTSFSSTTTSVNNDHQQQNHNNKNNNINNTNKLTCSPIQPGTKLWDRITTPFHKSGLQCFQVIQVHNTASDKKAYNSYRLAVDSNLSSKGIRKYGFGGEGNEHKRFVPLMAGCGGHLYGLRLASQLPHSQLTSPKDSEIEGSPFVCQDPACDVCRILESGLKLTAISGRSSHFSVPTLDAVLPWCNDASAPAPGQHQQQQQQQQQNSTTPRFQAAALIRTVLGNAQVVHDFNEVSESEPAQGFDSVVCVEEETKMNNSSNLSNPKTDSAFNYNDQGVLCEYIVLFANPTSSSSSS